VRGLDRKIGINALTLFLSRLGEGLSEGANARHAEAAAAQPVPSFVGNVFA